MKKLKKNFLIWLIIGFILSSFYNFFTKTDNNRIVQDIAFSDFLNEVEKDNVLDVNIKGDLINGNLADGGRFKTYTPYDPNLIEKLSNKNVKINVEPYNSKGSSFLHVILSWFPMLLLIGVWLFFMRQMQSGSGKALGFGRSKAKMLNEKTGKITFKDVAGIDESKNELQEVVEFLKDPSKFQRLGGKIPKGVLLIGPPGCGKTLLGRAVAGEAGVPFFSISGSDFVEMFVGVGASRVRDMFEQAKRQAPCIVFIDEIDAVGRHRGAGLGGGHDEREQTLNQLLVEMDGFEQNEGIIIIAATNRPDVLDPALLRPGRFDRQVVVPLPDIRGREQILKVHMKKVPLSEDVDPSLIARGTPGFSGADLANLVNEAALVAARTGKKLVGMEQLDFAKDKVMMGTERKSMVMSEEDKLKTAYHEAGHAIVGRSLKEHDPVYKVTIIPRGRALGVTVFLPEEDKYSHSHQYILDRICGLYGGRIAEQIVYGEKGITTGASNDIERATELARDMVTKWGLSEELGPIRYGNETDEPFLGRTVGSGKQDISDETASRIDLEVKRILSECYLKATEILNENIDRLHLMAESLVEYETLDSNQIDDIMAGAKPRAQSSNKDETNTGKKKDSSVGDAAEQN